MMALTASMKISGRSRVKTIKGARESLMSWPSIPSNCASKLRSHYCINGLKTIPYLERLIVDRR